MRSNEATSSVAPAPSRICTVAEGRHGRRAEVDAYGLTRWRVVDAAVHGAPRIQLRQDFRWLSYTKIHGEWRGRCGSLLHELVSAPNE